MLRLKSVRMGLFATCFPRLLFLFPPPLGDGPIKTEILSQRAAKPKQPTNQSITLLLRNRLSKTESLSKNTVYVLCVIIALK